MKNLLKQILPSSQLKVLKRIKFYYLRVVYRVRLLRRISTISAIHLEFVNYCNLKCKWCSLDRVQKRCAMKEDLLCRLFDNLLSDKRLRSVKTLNLWNGGEILLHPRLLDMLNIVKRYKAAFAERRIPFPAIHLITNGIELTSELSRDLVNLDIADSIFFSVDGGSREKYEELRKGAKWDTIYRNIVDFVKINNGKIRTGINCVVENDKELTTDWMTDEFRRLLDLVDRFELRHPHDWIGNVEVEGHKKTVMSYCRFLIYSLVVLPNGDVAACCADLNGEWPIGNLYSDDLYRIYSSRRRQEMISNVLAGRRDKIKLCENCGGYG